MLLLCGYWPACCPTQVPEAAGCILQGVPKPYLVPEDSVYRALVERCAQLFGQAGAPLRQSKLSVSSTIRRSSASWARISAPHHSSEPRMRQLSDTSGTA